MPPTKAGLGGRRVFTGAFFFMHDRFYGEWLSSTAVKGKYVSFRPKDPRVIPPLVNNDALNFDNVEIQLEWET